MLFYLGTGSSTWRRYHSFSMFRTRRSGFAGNPAIVAQSAAHCLVTASAGRDGYQPVSQKPRHRLSLLEQKIGRRKSFRSCGVSREGVTRHEIYAGLGEFHVKGHEGLVDRGFKIQRTTLAYHAIGDYRPLSTTSASLLRQAGTPFSVRRVLVQETEIGLHQVTLFEGHQYVRFETLPE